MVKAAVHTGCCWCDCDESCVLCALPLVRLCCALTIIIKKTLLTHAFTQCYKYDKSRESSRCNQDFVKIKLQKDT